MKLAARLAIYAAALLVVVTARLPEASTTIAALRTAAPEPVVDPVRFVIAAVLVSGIALELLRRRHVWH
jgi:hypothetical protein